MLFGGVYGGERRRRDISVRHVVRHARRSMKKTKDVLNAAECAKRRRKRNEDVDDVDEDDDAITKKRLRKRAR